MSLTYSRMTWKRCWSWVSLSLLVSTLAGFLALWVFGVLTDHIFRAWFQSVAFNASKRRTLEYAILMVTGSGAGVVIGLSTAIAFRQILNSRSLIWWLLTTIGGAALILPGAAVTLNAIIFTWAPSEAFDYPLFALSALIAGSGLGSLQGLVLRQHIRLAIWWPLAVGASWLALITMFYLLASSLHL